MSKKKPSIKKDINTLSGKSSALRNFFGAIGLVVILALISTTLFPTLVHTPKIQQKALDSIAEHHVLTQAISINTSINRLRFRLKKAAEAYAEPLPANRSNITTDQLLTQKFPEAVNIQVIPLGPLGIAKLESDILKKYSNVEIDMLRKVGEGNQVDPEAYKYQDDWHIAFAEIIPNTSGANDARGLLLTLNADYFGQFFHAFDGSKGRSQLSQGLNKRQFPFIHFGEDGMKGFLYSTKLNVSNWQLSFSPSSSLKNEIEHHSIFGQIVPGIAILIAALSLFLLYFLTNKLISKNLTELETSISKKKAQIFTIPAFETTAHTIISNVKAIGVKGTKKQLQNLKNIEKSPANATAPNTQAAITADELEKEIFRAYDIRGIADTQLNDKVVEIIGQAIASAALQQGQSNIIVARDGRHSSPRIQAALSKGINTGGCDVVDIGMVPTPVLYFATHHLSSQSGVMVTGSHNPSDYNGLKIVIDGKALSGNEITQLRDNILANNLSSGSGSMRAESVSDEYIERIISDVAIAQQLKVVIDAGNGVAGDIAPQLFEALGCEVIPLYCEVDGDFPNHHPDPSVASNMQALIDKVCAEGADLGIAFDGDADRIGVVTSQGKLVPSDRLLMLFAQDVVSRNPGADVIFDVKCTRHLNSVISSYGGRPIMWKTGHSFMKEKMAETGALLGGEYSGHIFFKERWFGFDDGMYAGARLVEILSTVNPDLDMQLTDFPTSIDSPEIKVEIEEVIKFETVEELAKRGDFSNGKISSLDGVRVDFADGWGLVRASNTTPMLILRFEADSEQALARIKELFKEQISAIESSIDLNF